jgi:hypothetical protein
LLAKSLSLSEFLQLMWWCFHPSRASSLSFWVTPQLLHQLLKISCSHNMWEIIHTFMYRQGKTHHMTIITWLGLCSIMAYWKEGDELHEYL